MAEISDDVLLSHNLLKAIRSRGYSFSDLHKKCKLQSSNFSSICKGEAFPCTLTTLMKISEAVNYSLHELFDPDFDPWRKDNLPSGYCKLEVIATNIQAVELMHVSKLNEKNIKKQREKFYSMKNYFGK